MRISKLTLNEWEEIHGDLLTGRPIAQIARDYGLSRAAIYGYAFRHGWMEKRKKTFWEKVKTWLKF